jgi:hypothetical protein
MSDHLWEIWKERPRSTQLKGSLLELWKELLWWGKMMELLLELWRAASSDWKSDPEDRQKTMCLLLLQQCKSNVCDDFESSVVIISKKLR